MTLEDLADAAGLSVTFLPRLERGQVPAQSAIC